MIGSEQDAEEIISSHGDAKSLATWCAFLKRELNESRRNKRQEIDKNEKLCRELNDKKKVLQLRSDELLAAREQLKHSEQVLERKCPVYIVVFFLSFIEVVGWYGTQNFNFNCTLKKMDFFFRIFLYYG